MFTGIITALGQLAGRDPLGLDQRLHINTGQLDRSGSELGESIAVNGVCLTVTQWDDTGFAADVSAETLRLTTLGELGEGAPLNLERSLRASDRLGGHIVSGHVDGLAEVIDIRDEGRSRVIELRVPAELSHYIARKGSVALDGVSLTVNTVADTSFAINVIPHTAEATTIGSWQPGSRVNLEIDVVARYLERMMMPQGTSAEN